MARYNHAFTIAFEVISEEPDGSDVTAEMFREALERRMKDLDDSRPDKSEWQEACQPPYDTYEEEAPQAS